MIEIIIAIAVIASLWIVWNLFWLRIECLACQADERERY